MTRTLLIHAAAQIALYAAAYHAWGIILANCGGCQ